MQAWRILFENTREKLLENDAAAARLFALLQGCISGQIRLISMMEFETSPPWDCFFCWPSLSVLWSFLKEIFRKFGLHFAEGGAEGLRDCLSSHGLGIVYNDFDEPLSDRKGEEHVLTTTAKINNTVLIVVDVYTAIHNPDWGYFMELRYALPGKLSQNNQDAVFKTLVLRRLRYRPLQDAEGNWYHRLHWSWFRYQWGKTKIRPSWEVAIRLCRRVTLIQRYYANTSWWFRRLFRNYLKKRKVLPFLPADFFTNLFNKTQNTSSLDNDTYASHLCSLKDEVRIKVLQILPNYSPWEEMVMQKLDLPRLYVPRGLLAWLTV